MLNTLDELGVGCLAFSPIGQGLLTDKYLNGVPPQSRASLEGSFQQDFLNQKNLNRVRALNAIAKTRGQSLAQMAIAWVLRDPRVTGTVVGARSVAQLDNSLDALNNLEFSCTELQEIDRYAQDGGIDLWKEARES